MFTCSKSPEDRAGDEASRNAAPISVERDTEGFSRPAVEGIETVLGSLDPAGKYRMQLTVQPKGCAIGKLTLNNHFATVKDKAAFKDCEGDVGKYLEMVKKDEDLHGFYTLLHPVGTNSDICTLSTEKVRVMRYTETEKGKDKLYFLTSLTGTGNWVKDSEQKDDDGVVYSVTYKFFIGYGKCLAIYKTYSLEHGSYSVGVNTRIENKLDDKFYIDLQTVGPVGMTREGTRMDIRRLVVGRQKGGAIETEMPTDYEHGKLDRLEFEGQAGKWRSLGSEEGGRNNIAWLGSINKYFGAYLYAKPEKVYDLRAEHLRPECFAQPITRGSDGRSWKPALVTKNVAVGAGKSVEMDFDFYAGPKDRAIFQSNELYKKLRYVDTITIRGCFCAWDWVRSGLMRLLNIFSEYLFFGNYGLAIILLVAVVRVILHPLAKKGQVNMARTQKKMAKLKPEIDRIKQKYANDRQTLNQEMMKIYKDHGNPMGGMMLGCLPMLLQMPIWIALYTGLNSNVALRHEGLLPFWLTDLSAPDFLIDFGVTYNIPLISALMGPIASFNLLPILLCAAMYLQSKYGATAQATDATTTPEQQQQQKMMRIMMPVMMLLFFYNAPSGLALYIMVSTTVGLIESRYIKKHIREEEEVKAATETVVKVSGKGPRGSRAKKPKSPFQK